MTGSHRAPVPTRRSRVPTVLLLVLLLGAAAGGVYAWDRSSGDDRSRAPVARPTTTSTVRAPAQTPTRSPAHSPTVHSTPPPAARRTAKPIPSVPPSAPHQLVVRGVLDVGFDAVVAPRDGVFRAASTAEVARWGGRGVPGNPSTDTVYVIGKVSPGGGFARLGRLHRGTRISVRTDSGVLTYTVQATQDLPARGLTQDASFKQGHVGRLQLVGIRYDAAGDRTGRILVVTAQLTAARRGA